MYTLTLPPVIHILGVSQPSTYLPTSLTRIHLPIYLEVWAAARGIGSWFGAEDELLGSSSGSSSSSRSSS